MVTPCWYRKRCRHRAQRLHLLTLRSRIPVQCVSGGHSPQTAAGMEFFSSIKIVRHMHIVLYVRLYMGRHLSPVPKSAISVAMAVNDAYNPQHLRWGSCHDNHLDMIAHGRSTRGERNPAAKLTEDAVRDIRERCEKGEDPAAISASHSVGIWTVKRIESRRSWGWLT